MTHDTTGPRANLRTPWVAPTEDVAADARDVKIAALKALLKEALAYVEDRVESGFFNEADPHGPRRARDLMARINKELGDDN